MNWPTGIAGDLPAPRDDEPASLRQDIADELADHLASAFNRELHFTPEETAAKQTVLDRFGDPRHVARQLWFDAMKEKIMSQRLNLVLCSIMTAACIGALGLMVLLQREDRRSTAALIEQSRIANTALIEKLASLVAPARIESSQLTELNPVKFRLVTDEAGGSPAEGYQAYMSGYLFSSANSTQIVRIPRADGIADFGFLRAGQHTLSIHSPWGESLEDTLLTIVPGKGVDQEIICPSCEREGAVVTFSVNWPEDLRGGRYWLVCHAYQDARQFGGKDWNDWETARHRYFVITADNQVSDIPILDILPQRNDIFGTHQQSAHAAASGDVAAGLYRNDSVLAARDELLRQQQSASAEARKSYKVGDWPESAVAGRFSFVFPDAPRQGELNWPAGRYVVLDMLVLEPPVDMRVGKGLRLCTVVGGLVSNDIQPSPGTNPDPVGIWEKSGRRRPRQLAPKEIAKVRGGEHPFIELVSGRANQITLSLPAKLVENIREAQHP
jgi:hypothetical protein